MPPIQQSLQLFNQFKDDKLDPFWTINVRNPIPIDNELYELLFAININQRLFTSQALAKLATTFQQKKWEPYFLFAERCLIIAQNLSDQDITTSNNYISLAMQSLAYYQANNDQYKKFLDEIKDLLSVQYYTRAGHRPSVVYFSLSNEYYADTQFHPTIGGHNTVREFWLSDSHSNIRSDEQKSIVVKSPLHETTQNGWARIKIERDYFRYIYPDLWAHVVLVSKENLLFYRLIMPYIRGQTLDRYMQLNTKKEAKLRGFIAAAQELQQQLHKVYVAHGDIKGPNILLQTNLNIETKHQDDKYPHNQTTVVAKYIDFGAAYCLNQFATTYPTSVYRAGLNQNNCYYHIPPERFVDNQKLRADYGQETFSFASLFIPASLKYNRHGFLKLILRLALHPRPERRSPLIMIYSALLFEFALTLGLKDKKQVSTLINEALKINPPEYQISYQKVVFFQQMLLSLGTYPKKTNRQIHDQLVRFGLFRGDKNTQNESYRMACLANRNSYRRFVTEQIGKTPQLR